MNHFQKHIKINKIHGQLEDAIYTYELITQDINLTIFDGEKTLLHCFSL